MVIYKVGDYVKLRNGSRKMIVKKIDDQIVTCVWAVNTENDMPRKYDSELLIGWNAKEILEEALA